eukprot:4847355-Prymnesium_polylepis.1
MEATWDYDLLILLLFQERKNKLNVRFSSGTSDLYTFSGLLDPLPIECANRNGLRTLRRGAAMASDCRRPHGLLTKIQRAQATVRRRTKRHRSSPGLLYCRCPAARPPQGR